MELNIRDRDAHTHTQRQMQSNDAVDSCSFVVHPCGWTDVVNAAEVSGFCLVEQNEVIQVEGSEQCSRKAAADTGGQCLIFQSVLGSAVKTCRASLPTGSRVIVFSVFAASPQLSHLLLDKCGRVE